MDKIELNTYTIEGYDEFKRYLDDDEEDPTETNQMDSTKDHIGYVQKEFKDIPIYYAPPTDKFQLEEAKNEEAGEIIIRALGQRYNEFRSVLAGEINDSKDKPSKALAKSKKFDPKTYPQRS